MPGSIELKRAGILPALYPAVQYQRRRAYYGGGAELGYILLSANIIKSQRAGFFDLLAQIVAIVEIPRWICYIVVHNDIIRGKSDD
jgi:hypothetical protein